MAAAVIRDRFFPMPSVFLGTIPRDPVIPFEVVRVFDRYVFGGQMSYRTANLGGVWMSIRYIIMDLGCFIGTLVGGIYYELLVFTCSVSLM